MTYDPKKIISEFGKGDVDPKDEGIFRNILKKVGLEKALILWHIVCHPKEAMTIFSAGDFAVIVAAVFYAVSPIDAIPDWIIGIGFIDDAAVLTYVLKRFSDYIDKYKRRYNL